MSSFTVTEGNGNLTANWSIDAYEVSGELIVNNISVREYVTYNLTAALFALRSYQFAVVNGQQMSVRLITKNLAGGIVRNLAVQSLTGKTVPNKMSIEVESRNSEIGIKLLNYDPEASAINGFSPVTNFHVLIDSGDNVDKFQLFSISDINQGFLVLSELSSGVSLVNGTKYEIVVRAVNSVGPGPFSDPADVTPSERPRVVNNFSANEMNQSVELTWDEPEEENTYSYRISKKLHSASQWDDEIPLESTYLDENQVEQPRTSYIFTSLTNGNLYNFKIIVDNTYGEGISSFTSGTPFTIPAEMSDSNVIVTDLSNNSIMVKLTQPSNNGGKAIASYKMIRQTDPVNNINLVQNFNPETKTAEFIIPSLPLGQLMTFQIYARNTNVDNAPHAYNYTQYANPNSVESLAAENKTAALSSNGVVKLSWVLPSNKGGALQQDFTHVIKYQPWDLSGNIYVLKPEISVSAGNLLEYTISSLVVGKQYSFKVQSSFTKNNGSMFVSSDSSSVSIVPNCAPDKPAPAIAMSEDKLQMKVTWAEPALFGLALSKYQIKIVRSDNLYPNMISYVNNGVSREFLYTPPVYGVAYKVYMKTFTSLDCDELESVEYISADYIPYRRPDAVSNLELYPLDGAVEVRWSALEGVAKGGFTDIRYKVIVNGTPSLTQTVTGSSSRVSNLANEEVYISIIAVGYLSGEPNLQSIDNPVKKTYPYNDPEPPTGLKLVPGDRQVMLNWTASATYLGEGEDAPAISYIIFRDDVKLSGVEITGGELTYTNHCLTNGRQYKYRVVTKQTFTDKVTYSDNFTDSASEKAATPFKNPEAPQNMLLSPSDASMRVSWQKESSLNGLPEAAHYRIEVYKASVKIIEAVVSGVLEYTFNGLENGVEHDFKVFTRAQYAGDAFEGELDWYESNASLDGSATPNVTPIAPDSVVCTAGDQKIDLSWVEPVDENYETLNYEMYLNGVPVATTTNLYYSFTGLINGTAYSVGVRLVTVSGEKSDLNSAVFNNQIPFGLPIVRSVTRVTVNGTKQVELVVGPNGSPVKDLIVFAAPAQYVLPVGTESYVHISNPLNPAPTEKVADLTLTTTQLRIAANINGVFYAVSNTAGVRSGQISFV